jgi:hypothetical protein
MLHSKRVQACIVFVFGCALLDSLDGAAQVVRRSEILSRVRPYAEINWTPQTANLTAGCITNYKPYYSLNVPVTGMAYRWGGSDTPEDFKGNLKNGLGAGAHKWDAENVNSPCTTGIDCSGLVCNVWKRPHAPTASFPDFTTNVTDRKSLKTGDAFLRVGRHVMLFVGLQDSGNPILYEAEGKNVHRVEKDWGDLELYTAVRYNSIQD